MPPQPGMPKALCSKRAARLCEADTWAVGEFGEDLRVRPFRTRAVTE